MTTYNKWHQQPNLRRDGYRNQLLPHNIKFRASLQFNQLSRCQQFKGCCHQHPSVVATTLLRMIQVPFLKVSTNSIISFCSGSLSIYNNNSKQTRQLAFQQRRGYQVDIRYCLIMALSSQKVCSAPEGLPSSCLAWHSVMNLPRYRILLSADLLRLRYIGLRRWRRVAFLRRQCWILAWRYALSQPIYYQFSLPRLINNMALLQSDMQYPVLNS